MSYLDKNGLQRYHNGIKTELDNKADIDGTYEELTAGYANNLKFTGYREDNTPYILRQSGGDVDPGYKSEKTIVGASIVMNQLVHNGDFGRTTWWGAENGDISVADNVLTYVCTTSGSLLQNGIFADIDAEIDHVYFVTADIKTEKANSGQWFFLTGSAIVSEANTWTTISELKKATVTDTYFGIGLRVTTDVGETFQARNAFIIDITKMFGTNIANYVYGLETTTSGFGIAWLKQYFPAQFNSGYQAFSDGEIKSVSGLVSHNTYDENGVVIDICSLDSELTLRGIYKLDTNNKLYADGDAYSADGTVERYWAERAYQSGDISDGSTMITDGTTTVYKLSTTTTETAEPYSSSQRVNPDGTEEFIFDSTTEVKLPVGHVTKYMDQAALLDEIITPPDKAGTYALRKTVSDGVTTYTWEDDVIPSISVSKADGVSTITVTDETGTNSVEIADGETPHLVLLSYGTSTWTDFIDAYTTNSIVYCRASSNSNPASGSKTRLAFMAYVNNETNPTNVEFQYYRSVNQHSATQQGDQVYVYKLDKTAGWTVTVRESYTRVVAGTKMSSTWSNGILTMNFDGHDLPSGGTTGQVLKKTSGTDYDASWGDIPSEYVTNTDYADSSTGGVVKVDDGTMGVKLSNDNVLQTNGANSQIIKVGENTYRPICPNYQHESVFYGLAKAAGDGTQKNSNNSVGTYTDNAKRAIRNMMGVPHYAYDLELGQSVGEYDNLNSFYLGVYSCDATTAATVSNTPITNTAYKLICEATSNNTVRQTVITTTGQIYIRTGDNSTSSWVWSNWAVQSNSGGSGSSNNTNILNGSATGSLRSVNSEQEDSNYTIGLNAAAFCYNSIAQGTGSFAENSGFAYGDYSHAEGNGYAQGAYSHAEGYHTHAYENYQHVFGTYNKYYIYVDPINLQNSEAIEIVGNGTSNNPSNARTLDFLGNERLAGSITLGADTNDEVTLTATELATLKTLAGIESEVF